MPTNWAQATRYFQLIIGYSISSSSNDQNIVNSISTPGRPKNDYLTTTKYKQTHQHQK
jgi:hypothetical protein